MKTSTTAHAAAFGGIGGNGYRVAFHLEVCRVSRRLLDSEAVFGLRRDCVPTTSPLHEVVAHIWGSHQSTSVAIGVATRARCRPAFFRNYPDGDDVSISAEVRHKVPFHGHRECVTRLRAHLIPVLCPVDESVACCGSGHHGAGSARLIGAATDGHATILGHTAHMDVNRHPWQRRHLKVHHVAQSNSHRVSCVGTNIVLFARRQSLHVNRVRPKPRAVALKRSIGHAWVACRVPTDALLRHWRPAFAHDLAFHAARRAVDGQNLQGASHRHLVKNGNIQRRERFGFSDVWLGSAVVHLIIIGVCGTGAKPRHADGKRFSVQFGCILADGVASFRNARRQSFYGDGAIIRPRKGRRTCPNRQFLADNPKLFNPNFRVFLASGQQEHDSYRHYRCLWILHDDVFFAIRKNTSSRSPKAFQSVAAFAKNVAESATTIRHTITSKMRFPFHSIHCGSAVLLFLEKSKVTR